MFYDKYIKLCEGKGISPSKAAEEIGFHKSSITNWKNNGYTPRREILVKLSDYFGVSVDYLLGAEPYSSVTISDDFVTFPVIGDVAAGYEHIALEDWKEDTIDIPKSYLKGHHLSDYFVLRIIGDSMYPMYQQGDKVLILKQSTLDHSGQIGVVLYGGNTGTLKKVEYVMGEDWMKLIPINPMYSPMMIEGADLEDCRVLGVPKLLIREIED